MQSTSQSNSQRKNRRSLQSLIVFVVLLTIALIIALNRQYILDYVHFTNYKPSADMAAVVERAGLSDPAKFVFYATRPEIENSKEFNKNCDKKEQGTAILGCYVNDRIYVYNVMDPQLDGIREVTSVHEMLHAVYQRMSDDGRKRIDALVEAEFAKLNSDPKFADRMAFYARTEPGERYNELHSIIGTEVTNISPELEKHYAQYFNDRTKLLGLFNGYNSRFIEIDNQAKQLSNQLDALSAKLDAEMSAYNTAVQKLNDDISDFNRRAESNDFTSPAAFNRERQTLVGRAEAVTESRAIIDSDLRRYEELRLQYNETVTTSNNLYKSIDSSLAPTPSV